MKLKSLIERFFRPTKLLKAECEHDKVEVVLNDIIFDKATDNDDMEDEPTLIRVAYCRKCGEILSIQPEPHKVAWNEITECYSRTGRESPLSEIYAFEDTTGINARSVTLWQGRKPLKKFQDVYKAH